MGCSPLEEARTRLKVLAHLKARPAGEMTGPIGSILQIPNMSANRGSQAALSRQVNRLRGQAVLFDSSPGHALRESPLSTDYRPIRLGANLP